MGEEQLLSNCFIGVDVGSVAIKAALVTVGPVCMEDSAGYLTRLEAPLSAHRIYLSPYKRIHASPMEAVEEVLARITGVLPPGCDPQIIFTGSGGRTPANMLGCGYIGDFRALARSASALYPDSRALMEMGGEGSRFIQFDPNGEGTLEIIAYGVNGDCAAGTGSFMDQQATRLGFEVEAIGAEARSASRSAKIAGRCSVFAKSDMIHAQQKGAEPAQVLKGLCEAVARNYKGTVAKGMELGGKVLFTGGLARNSGVVEAMRDVFSLDGNLTVADQPEFMGAIGAALALADPNHSVKKIEQAYGESDESWPPLTSNEVTFLSDSVTPPPRLTPGEPLYLGVDVGSVSTNLVLIRKNGEVVDELYLRTRARPIEVVTEGLATFGERHRGFPIAGVGTTGSGRELIGELIGADTVNDEITAHKTGAFHIASSQIDGEVDTIFEIGGQDAKFISLSDSIVVDFSMNEACAAGTGSFLEEQAEKLGIRIEEEFSALAFASKRPLRLGERCTVYMESDVAHHIRMGAKKEDVIAGLAYSVVQNYLNRVVRGRAIGDTIFFQGGTAYNRSVAAAFAAILGKKIIVPPMNGVMGAYGAALLALDKMSSTECESTFRGFDLESVDYDVMEFTCNACENRCDIQQFTVEGNKTYWGDKCSEKYRKASVVEREPVIEDLFEMRAALLELDYFSRFLSETTGEAASAAKKCRNWSEKSGKARKKPTVAMLRALYFYDRFPFWKTYFNALGMEVTASEHTTRRIGDSGVECAVADPCFPIQAAHGHLASLESSEADLIVLPARINVETDDKSIQSHSCPWGQTLPFVLKVSPAAKGLADKLVTPLVHFREGEKFVERQLWSHFGKYARNRAHHRASIHLGYLALGRFTGQLTQAGTAAIEALERGGEQGIVLVGRPYNLYDPGLNMNIPAKLRSQYGINVIPMDCLPQSAWDVPVPHSNMYWNYGRRILRAAKYCSMNKRLHMIYLTNFKCGPDSYVKSFAVDTEEKPFLTLQFDSHGNDAGMMTRCEAYLDSKGFLRWWNDPSKDLSQTGSCTSHVCAAAR